MSMSQRGYLRLAPTAPAPSPGVRTRRRVRLVLDVVIVAAVTAVVWTALLDRDVRPRPRSLLPPLFPIVAVLLLRADRLRRRPRHVRHAGVRSRSAAARQRRAGRPFINAAAQALLFYVSWFLPLVFVVTLVDGEKRFLHDILSGVVVRQARDDKIS